MCGGVAASCDCGCIGLARSGFGLGVNLAMSGVPGLTKFSEACCQPACRASAAAAAAVAASATAANGDTDIGGGV